MADTKYMNFTKAALLEIELPAMGKRSTYHDTKVPGLEVRVTDKGTKTFSVFRRPKGGEPTRITIGQFPVVTVEQARQQAMQHLSELANGNDVAAVKRAARAESTFKNLFDEYLARHSKVKKRTWDEDESKYKQYLSGPLGNKRLSDIKRKQIAEIHSKITADGHPVTANRVLALISSIFGWAISVDLFDANPANGVHRNPEKSRDRFIQATELPMFFQALDAEINESLRDFFTLALLTGARRTNMLEMSWQDIDFDEAQWLIPRTKNGDSQRVVLVPKAIAILKARKKSAKSPFVFPGKGATGHLVEPKSAWRRVLVRMAGLNILNILNEHLDWDEEVFEDNLTNFLQHPAPEKALATLSDLGSKANLLLPSPLIPDIRIHDLRRTLASWQVKTGAPLPVIGKSLNHKSSSTTAIYARSNTDEVRNAVTKAADAMKEAGRAKRVGVKQS